MLNWIKKKLELLMRIKMDLALNNLKMFDMP